VGPDMRLEPDYAAAAMQLAATEASLDDQQRALARRIADQSGEPTWRRRLVESIDGEGLHPKLSPAGAALVKFLASTPDAPGTMRKVGPSLRDVASRLDFPFLAGWIARPADFRPTTRMPRLFGLHKSLGAKGKAESDRLEAVELQVLAEWLLDVSQPVEPLTISAVGSPDEKRVFAPASAERGRRLLLTQGCLACHQHDDYPESTGAQGPDLSRLGAKYPSAKAAAWLADWLRDPARRSPRTRMPNSQLEPIRLPGESDAAIVSDPVSDLVAYLLGPAGSVFGRSSPVSEADLDELVLAHLTKHYSREQAERILQRGLDAERTDAALGDAVELVGPVSRKKKLRYVARRTVAKRGCFGCHDIPGFELAQPIGPALSDWGRKDESLLAFGRVEQLLADDGTADRAATDPDVGFYLDAVAGHRREGFLWQKLRAPRSFDYDRTVEKDYHQRLKMGQFTLDAQQREAVATFVLGLVAQPPASKYVYGPDPAGRAIAEGRKVLDRHACAECHVLEMDRWRFAYRPGEVAAPRASDEFAFMRPHLSREQLAASMRTDPRGRAQAELLGMPQRSADGRVAEFEGDEEDAEGEPLPMRAFSLWEPAAIAGHPWTVGGPDVLVYDDQITKQYAPWGGAAARLIYPAAVADARAAGVNVTGMEIWGRLPPPLVGEGAKVQTDWLVDYLVDPQPIRPAAILKMPKYVLSADELDKLADFFAARSGVSRIAGVGSVSPGPAGQRDNAMRLITDRKTFCAKCHVIGDYRPGETATTFAPDLQDAGRRLRPEYVRRWLAHPKAVLPYTSMPVNFPPSGDPLGQDLLPGSSAQQIDAVVELLDGYDEYLREKTSIRKRIEVSHD
ncbi:MAG: c-type cytochrome, partial [Pirellulales bacterium]|nr:c-type cytochrome [Pirellulales bacterium]